MSQVVSIKSSHEIENKELAKQALSNLSKLNKDRTFLDINIEEKRFVYRGYQHDDGVHKEKSISLLEDEYYALLRENKKQKVIENAKKLGYTLKRESVEGKKVKLVLQKRIY